MFIFAFRFCLADRGIFVRSSRSWRLVDTYRYLLVFEQAPLDGKLEEDQVQRSQSSSYLAQSKMSFAHHLFLHSEPRPSVALTNSESILHLS